MAIALTDRCNLNEMGISRRQQDRIKRKYRTLAFMGNALSELRSEPDRVVSWEAILLAWETA